MRIAVYFILLSVALPSLTACGFLKRNKGGAEGGDQVAVAAQEDAEVVPAIPEPDGGLAEPVAEGESTAAADALLEQMKTGGLTVDQEFKKVGAKWGAKNCIEGKIDTIPTILCEFADADAAKANKDKAVEYAKGEPTGVVDRNGKTIIAVRSNKELDKNGEKVNKIITAFNKAK
ncbi:MAG TPA: hypothetical protein VGQ83_28305 [Polyangia bacterium]|jgi:hypothetical protein